MPRTRPSDTETTDTGSTGTGRPETRLGHSSMRTDEPANRRPALTPARLVDVPIGTLQETVVKALRRSGATAERARRLARDLVANELDGYRDQGLQRLPATVEALEADVLKRDASPRVESLTDRSWRVDGRGCFESDLASSVAETLVRGAREGGMACVTVLTDTPPGRLASIAGPVADAGLVVMGFSNASGDDGRVVPPGGRQGRLGSNPVVFAAPCGEPLGSWNEEAVRRKDTPSAGANGGASPDDRPPGPVIVDVTTSTASEGEVRDRVTRREPVPEGWLVDSQGRPVRQGDGLFQDPPTAFLSPLGGAAGCQKGFGLGLMVEILAGVLTGAGFSGSAAADDGAPTHGALFVALSPTVAGRDEEGVRHDVARLARHLQESGEGGRVHIPGWEAGDRRRKAVLYGSLAVPTELWVRILRLAHPRPDETENARPAPPPTFTTAEVAARWGQQPHRHPRTARRIAPRPETSAPLAPAAAARHRSDGKPRRWYDSRGHGGHGGNGGAPAAGEGGKAGPPMAAKPRR